LNKRIRTLVGKDLRIHGRSIVVTQCAVIGLGFLAVALRPQAPQADLAVPLFSFNLLLAGYWGDWFVSREKLKGTVAWLRSLPVADYDLVTSKLVAQAICSVTLWVLTSGVFLWGFFVPGRVATWAVLQLALLAFGALSLACRWRFHQKVGQTLPFAVLFVPVALLVVTKRLRADLYGQLGAMWDAPGAQLAAAVVMLIAYAAVWWGTLAWMRGSDTSRLVE